MSCYHHLLIAHDGSPGADAALEHAIRLAHDQHARLTLLTVVPAAQQPAAMGAPPTPDLLDCYSETQRRLAEEIPADVSLTTRILRGDAAEAILRTAGEGEHDLVVMGSHGHGRVHRALLGSVSYRVLRESPIPVLLIPPESAELLAGEGAESGPIEETPSAPPGTAAARSTPLGLAALPSDQDHRP